MDQTRGLVESALLVALASMLFLASHVLPVVGAVVALVCPAPLVVLGLRHSLKRSILGMGVATLLVTAFVGPVGGLFFLFGFGVLGVGIGYLARLFDQAVEIMLYGILVSLGSKLVLMLLVTWVTGINPFSVDPAEIEGVMGRVSGAFGQWGLSGDATGAFSEQMKEALRILPMVFPALLIIASAVDCYLSYVVSRAVLSRLGRRTLPRLPAFEAWRFPRSLFIALVVALVLQFVGMSQDSAGLAMKMGLNLRMVVSLLFFIQGSSLALAFLRHKGVGRFRWVLLGLFLFVPFLSQLVMLVGIVDMWFDFRSRFGGAQE
ncbi:MAG: YybS family protein [Synergistales bacterium]|nr:YybS family protein [Synergistales bacterium]